MGGCVSSKAGGKKTRYTTLPPSYKTSTHKLMEAPDKNVSKRRAAPYTRGQSTLFGFKRRVASAPAAVLDNAEHNSCSLESLESRSPSESGKSSPQAGRSNSARANRFGFKSPVAVPNNKVSDSNANLLSKNSALKDKPRTKGGGKIIKPITGGHKPGNQQLTSEQRFTLQTSLLPTPQFPIRLASAEQDGRSKTAKTLANNCTRIVHGSDSNSSSGSLNADSGIGSQRSADLEITVLDRSPGSANRRLRKKRELEVVVQGKSFDVRDLNTKDADDLNVITEISVISLSTNQKPAMRVAPQLKMRSVNTGQVAERKLMYQQRGPISQPQSRPSARVAQTIHKHAREKSAEDGESQEKGDLMAECYNDWGQGEAMAEEFSVNEDGMQISNIQPRPIHLAIEEARFAAIAAADSSLIDDERSPVDSLMSNSTPSSDSSEPDKDKDKESPGSPTNASNSLSLSESRDRDFIDDEIADQPGLMFDEQVEEMQESLVTLEVTESNPETLKAVEALVIDTKEAPRKCSSVSTLSPCESITSDDLMIDFDRSEHSVNVSRADSRLGNVADSVLSQQEVFREWSQLLAAEHNGSGRLLRSRPTSTPDSPLSLDGRVRSSPSSSLTGSPLRPPRQSRDDDSSYIWLDRTSYQQMCQDIVNMKTMLLKLKRLFQDAETINPFDSSLKNGLFYSLAGGEGAGELDAGRGAEVTVQEEVVELRRQAVFLQQQVDERDRTIKLLQVQMSKYTTSSSTVQDAEKTNAATQTERIRPVSGSMMLPAESSNGPLVSSNERRRLSSPTIRRHTNTNIPTMKHTKS